MHCHELQQHAAEYVLGQLSDEQMRQIDLHQADCDACRQQIAATEQAAALLPWALPAATPPAELEQQLLHEITDPATVSYADAAGSPAAPTLARTPSALPRWLIAASLLAVATGVGVWVGMSLHTPNPSDRAEVDATIRQEAGKALEELIAAAQQKERHAAGRALRYVALEGAADAYGYVAADLTARQWHLLIRDLPPLPPGRVYRVWLAGDAADATRIWTSAGVLTVDEKGSAGLVVDMPATQPPMTRLTVTDELPGAEEPTGTAWLEAEL